MAKPEWGSKRVCLSCGARFYDMKRTPIVCPACETVLDPAANSKPRRSRTPAKAPVAVAAVVATVVALEPDEVETDDEVPVADDSEEESESAIEDVSELGDDDMSDVIDTGLDEDDAER
ncbi:MAG: TIGR02300 family protein [Geminicoccaceae bacterium]